MRGGGGGGGGGVSRAKQPLYNEKIDREGNKERGDLACYNGAAAAAEKKMKDGLTWLLGEIRLSVKVGAGGGCMV